MNDIPESSIEPMGAEAAIGWHLRQIAFHDDNESMADACDMPGSARFHKRARLKHVARLAVLEAEFPATALEARRQFKIEGEQYACFQEQKS